MLLGWTMAMGTVGGYLGNIGLSLLITHLGWQSSLLWTNALGLITLALGFLIIPNRQNGSESPNNLLASHQLVEILKKKEVWTYSFTALGIYLCISVIADLWGVSFIVQALGISKVDATEVVSLIYLGLCLGSLCLTFLGDFFRARQMLIKLSIGSIFVLASCLVYYPGFSRFSFSILFFILGFLGGAEMLCFANLCDSIGKRTSGTAIGFMNCIVMLGGACVAQQVGRLLDFFWHGQLLHPTGIRLYSIGEYRFSLSLVVIAILISMIISIFLPKQVETEQTIRNTI